VTRCILPRRGVSSAPHPPHRPRDAQEEVREERALVARLEATDAVHDRREPRELLELRVQHAIIRDLTIDAPRLGELAHTSKFRLRVRREQVVDVAARPREQRVAQRAREHRERVQAFGRELCVGGRHERRRGVRGRGRPKRERGHGRRERGERGQPGAHRGRGGRGRED
jgi:hypothetical protein